ncbi:MAG: response regulator [Alphaproteobacteria bacterium]|nr:response regulator [Alphaproteobacteria bacterium]
MTDRNTSPTRRVQLLVVEDEPSVRRSLQLLLRGRGFDVRAYASGLDLLADPTILSADGMVTDYRMPDVDGLMILARLREQGWKGGAVLITGFPSPDLAERAKRAGFEKVIEKPLVDAALFDAVERMLRAA